MNQLNLFIEVTRLKKSIGYLLLFWPCSWGLALVYNFSGEKLTFIFYLVLFLLGSILMRSAGCIINDIVDKKFDIKVHRTKNRPIATGALSVTKGILYSIILCLMAFLVLIQFNNFTIFLAILSMPLAFIYPLMKRYTYWPQLFLGITFNYGLILGWTSIANQINLFPVILYFGSIFWTLGYDTIYGYQDIKDDEIIGLKSTSIKFKKKPYLFLKVCYSIFFIILVLIGFLEQLNLFYYGILFIIILKMIYNLFSSLNINNPASCIKNFRLNNLIGLTVFIAITVGNLKLY